MTSKISRQDIIDMAAQAGFDDITPWLDAENVDQGTVDAANRWIDKMVSFAALVGFRVFEVEQEQCAAKVVAEGVAEYERGLKDGALLEREACAKMLLNKRMAEMIRSRSEAKP